MLYVGACYGVYFLLSGSLVAAMFTNEDLTIVVCNVHNPMECTLCRHIYHLVMVCDPCQECTEWLPLPLHQIGWREHGLGSTLTDPIKTAQLEASFDVADTRSSPVLSGFYAQLIPILICLNCSLILVSNLINCDARLGNNFCLYYRLTKCQPLR